jgi:hypothetical protein
VAVTEVAEGFGHAPAAADLMVQVDCLLVTGRGLGVVARCWWAYPRLSIALVTPSWLPRSRNISAACPQERSAC